MGTTNSNHSELILKSFSFIAIVSNGAITVSYIFGKNLRRVLRTERIFALFLKAHRVLSF